MTILYLRTNDYRLGTVGDDGSLQWPAVDLFHEAINRNSATIRYIDVNDQRCFFVMPPNSDSEELTVEVNDNPPLEKTEDPIISTTIADSEDTTFAVDTTVLQPETPDSEPETPTAPKRKPRK